MINESKSLLDLFFHELPQYWKQLFQSVYEMTLVSPHSPLAKLLLLSQSYYEQKFCESLTQEEVVFCLLNLFMPQERLDYRRLEEDLRGELLLLGGEYKKTCLVECEMREHTTYVELDSYDGIIETEKILITGQSLSENVVLSSQRTEDLWGLEFFCQIDSPDLHWAGGQRLIYSEEASSLSPFLYLEKEGERFRGILYVKSMEAMKASFFAPELMRQLQYFLGETKVILEGAPWMGENAYLRLPHKGKVIRDPSLYLNIGPAGVKQERVRQIGLHSHYLGESYLSFLCEFQRNQFFHF